MKSAADTVSLGTDSVLAFIRRTAERISDSAPTLIDQRDTFFTCPNGRLKLREFFITTPRGIDPRLPGSLVSGVRS